MLLGTDGNRLLPTETVLLNRSAHSQLVEQNVYVLVKKKNKPTKIQITNKSMSASLRLWIRSNPIGTVKYVKTPIIRALDLNGSFQSVYGHTNGTRSIHPTFGAVLNRPQSATSELFCLLVTYIETTLIVVVTN